MGLRRRTCGHPVRGGRYGILGGEQVHERLHSLTAAGGGGLGQSSKRPAFKGCGALGGEGLYSNGGNSGCSGCSRLGCREFDGT